MYTLTRYLLHLSFCLLLTDTYADSLDTSLPFLPAPETINSEQSPLFGDSNCDELINILDVVSTINHILDLNPEPYCLHNADLNDDGNVNILDVVFTINIILDLPGLHCPGIPTIADVDGNIYNTVLIGNQCWIKENLKTSRFRNGQQIDYPITDQTWQENTAGAYTWYENDISWKQIYGALYNWHAINNPNGLCPEGWHVPSDDEWTQLTDFVEADFSSIGQKLKSCRQVNSISAGACSTSEHPRWDEHPFQYGTDDYHLSLLPGAWRGPDGDFDLLVGSNGVFWTSTSQNAQEAWLRQFNYNNGFVIQNFLEKAFGFSVRCIKD